MQLSGQSKGQNIWIVLLAALVLCAAVSLPATSEATTQALPGLETGNVSDVGENVYTAAGVNTPLFGIRPITLRVILTVNPDFVTASDAYPGCILHGPPVQILPA